MATDNVNNPPHYEAYNWNIRTINFTRKMDFSRGNAFKYVYRAGFKGDAIEDLKKSLWYLNDFCNYGNSKIKKKDLRIADLFKVVEDSFPEEHYQEVLDAVKEYNDTDGGNKKSIYKPAYGKKYWSICLDGLCVEELAWRGTVEENDNYELGLVFNTFNDAKQSLACFTKTLKQNWEQLYGTR